ncbi:MAG: caspase family protein [Chlamydiae bacterium]|nr:caspase family protein [Chlamydiota bacterium]
MRKRAVCIGIDDYRGAGIDLRGCGNDARAWARLLEDGFGFRRGDIRVILDADATRRTILASLERLVGEARLGDVCVFIYSGHGTWVPERGRGDEADGRDEALVPWEADFERLITDDELRPVLDRIPNGIAFTVIADACYSGTATRFMPGGRIRCVKPPAAVAGRLTAAAPIRRRILGIGEERMAELYLSAAADDEPASEGEFDGVTRGAFSWFAVRELEASGPGITGEQLVARVRRALAAAGYPQRPQIEGPAAAKRRALFSPL